MRLREPESLLLVFVLWHLFLPYLCTPSDEQQEATPGTLLQRFIPEAQGYDGKVKSQHLRITDQNYTHQGFRHLLQASNNLTSVKYLLS